MKLLAVVAGLLAGCAQVLGLDNTTLDNGDGSVVDACAGVPANCPGTNGRSVCGQLFDTGENANKPLAVASPQGAACTGTEGPCGLAVSGFPQAQYLAGDRSGQIAGTIDDCGRFVVPDVDLDVADVAIELSGSAFVTTVTLVNGRSPMVGEDTDIAAFALTQATTSAWATQLSPGTMIDLSSGFLITYTAGMNRVPVPEMQVANDGGAFYVNPPGTPPFAGYFADSAFGTLDPALTQTATSGTAIAVLPLDQTVQLEGGRTGHARCKIAGLKQLANIWIHVVEVDC